MNEINYNNINITDKCISVHNIDHIKADKGDGWGIGIKENYVLFHIVSGKGIFISGGKKYFLEKGDSFVIYPYAEVEFHADDIEPWEYYKVTFSGDSVDDFMQYTDFTENSPVLTFNFDKKLEVILNKMCELDTNHIFYNVDITGLMFSLFSVLMGFSVFSKRIDSDMDFLITKVLDYISYNYSENITIESAAHYIGMSGNDFEKLFKDKNKVSFDEYLENYRIEKAAELIELFGFSTASVADSVGYYDSVEFSKVFRKIKGVSPSHYKKKKKFLNALKK